MFRSRPAFAALLLLIAFNQILAYSDESKTIRSVHIERQTIFPVITGKPRFLYHWANALHVVTRESVIQNALLFKPGDVYDPEILQESERNLREFPYLGGVDVAVVDEGDGYVDVGVRTQDQWSLLLSWILSRGGGRTIFGGTLEEFNFLGYGKRLFAEVSHEVSEGTQVALTFRDPQLFFSRWTTDMTFITGPFRKSFSGQLIRPFYSLDTRWAGGIAALANDATLRLFETGKEVSRLQLKTETIQLFGARAWGDRFNKKRLQLTYRFQEREFNLLPRTTTTLPQDELIHGTTLGFSFENVTFVEEKQLDKFVRTEDLTLGNLTRINIGRTGIPVSDGVRRFEFSASRREAHELWDKQYLILLFSFRSLFDKDTIGALRLQYYNRMLRAQTLALNIEMEFSDNLEASRQFLLGGDSGLRGYGARQFTGSKRVLMNVEERLFTPVTVLTVALGGVLFFDAGHVWRSGESVDLADLNYSVGAGLRLGFTRSPNSRVTRIDFAWAINDRSFGIVIGVDQQFSIN